MIQRAGVDGLSSCRSLLSRFSRIEEEHDREAMRAIDEVIGSARRTLGQLGVKRAAIEEAWNRGKLGSERASAEQAKIDDAERVANETAREAEMLRRLWPLRNTPTSPPPESDLPMVLDSERLLVGAVLTVPDVLPQLPRAEDFFHPLLGSIVAASPIDLRRLPLWWPRWQSTLIAECLLDFGDAPWTFYCLPWHARRVTRAAEARRRIEAIEEERLRILRENIG